MNTLQEFHSRIKNELIKKIHDDIIKEIEPHVQQLAVDISNDVYLSGIIQNDYLRETIKLDISENERVRELEDEIARLNRKLSQNGLH